MRLHIISLLPAILLPTLANSSSPASLMETVDDSLKCIMQSIADLNAGIITEEETLHNQSFNSKGVR